MMVFSLKRGTLLVDYPALPGEDTGAAELENQSGLLPAQGHLIATMQYADLEKSCDEALKNHSDNSPLLIPLLAQKALAVCAQVTNNGTDAIRISEVASLFTHCMDLLNAAEAAGQNDNWLEDTRATLARQVPEGFPKMAEATLLKRFSAISEEPKLVEDDEDIGIIIEQIDTAVDAFSHYSEFDGVEKAVVESVKPIIVNIGKKIIDLLLFTFLKNPDKDAYFAFCRQICRLLRAEYWALGHAASEEELETIRHCIAKAIKAQIEYNGYEYVQDEWGAFHKKNWFPPDMLDSQRKILESMESLEFIG
ncbi:MAG: hypothetical protein IJK04_11265 [Kiritimatiellae bacterium]|nr:hypothetical protein [Kiritimatiellia bacterium]